ncbi:hypothetical protein R7Z10_12120 [Vibrio sp. Vb1018]|uniref:lipopolysaccharide biosynthesis protein n=1 Tax=Vibrio sp. Vb1018 TaxID=3074636 RepID=UPI0029648294|nr:hypothetical protein [Vibrio sp. Vb1018]MDW1821130.1 hypothetical protein [Vibrio sp. Vb1018]
MTKLKARLTVNFLANIYAQVVSLIYLVLTVPLYLSFWHIELYGEWLVLSALPSYIALSNMGLMNVAQNKMTIAMSKGDLACAKTSLHTVWTAQLGISIIVGSLILLLVNVLDLASILKLKYISEDDARFVFCELAVFALLNLQVGIFGGIYRAVGKNSRGVVIINTIRLFSIVSVACLLILGIKNVTNISAVMVLSYIVGILFISYDSAKIAPNLRPGFKAFDISSLKESINLGLAFMAYPLGRAITNQGMLLFTNAYVGSASVVILTSLRSLVNMAFQISNLIHLSTWPEYSRLHGEKNLDGLRKLFKFSTSIGILFGVSTATFLLMFGPNLIELWTRGEVLVERDLLLLFIISIVFNSIWYTSSTIFNATNNHASISKIFFLASSVVPVSAWVLNEITGFELKAVGFSFILMETVMLLFVVPKALKLINVSTISWICNSFIFPFLIINKIKINVKNLFF